MLAAKLSRYVAAGCLVIESESRHTDGIWASVEPGQWLHFGPFEHVSAQDRRINSQTDHGPLTNPVKAAFQSGFLEQEVQDFLIYSSGCLASYADLLRKGWVHMSLSVSLDNFGYPIVRVYLLPDDVDNRTISRSDASLRKTRLALLGQLDFSRDTWQGRPRSDRSPRPCLFHSPETTADSPDTEGQSLLQMFNTIPSPDPNPDDIHDFDARDAAYRLMSSDIPGLITKLYIYQRRSAALMLHRETQGQQVLDPRLVKVADPLGRPWYYDAVTGTCLREPRYYDAPCGGILAEEMGAGKTLICLALILATRHIPSAGPDHLRTNEPAIRRRIGSLADMAAACITRNSVPWRSVFGALEPGSIEYPLCVAAIHRNPGVYSVPPPPRRRETPGRQSTVSPAPTHIFLSHCSLVIVPPNLVQQWKQEIAKHTVGLRVFAVDKKQDLPPATELADYDIILFSSTRFDKMWEDLAVDRNGAQVLRNSLAQIHFKRCIVDEGHKLGHATASRKSNMHHIIDHLHISARWIVTGTPSKGLYGVDDTPSPHLNSGQRQPNKRQAKTSADLEKEDLKRIGSIAMLYLQMRPWANQWTEAGDSPADWNVYVMQPQHSSRSTGREDCLKKTLESLIIRHRLSEVGDLLPTVDEKIVYLDGSFQDRLVLNLFSMMIIFNAVQSQRADQDYFFHPRQRKALLELVSNLRQASFFGGSFFSPPQILKAIETAEDFSKEGRVPISPADEALLRDAVEFGRLAAKNDIKRCANLFREVPLYVRNFPWNAGREWSLDLKDGDPMCTDSRMISALQKFLHPMVDAPVSLQMTFESGRFAERGREERSKEIEDQDPEAEEKNQPKPLAGNTQLGQDNSSPSRRRSAIMGKGSLKTDDMPAVGEDHGIAAPLAQAQLISTASAKLSYLVDQIVKYQESEQIIIFYENDNVAYYLAGVLEILQIQHLIYAKGLTPERRAQYVATFNHNPKFRVLLMDITQAAFGLDMQSASRIYFINPVLNPQVEAQAIGRARRISQKKPVSVETLVLRGSVEEVIVRRRAEMTQAEQWKCRSILDDKSIYEWILNARILPMPDGHGDGDDGGPGQMALLETPLFLFGRGFGRELAHPDQDLVGVNESPVRKKPKVDGGEIRVVVPESARKRTSPHSWSGTPVRSAVGTPVPDEGGVGDGGVAAPKKRARVRFAEADES
ncbi:helicase-like protein [Parathielavia appendiculata]|uniref:Helicase-like protein n=1 Tax=Parathielavia appendiculata TaxID=2587402 RepID=A0AAN6U5X1_9PEZI|nr:helicase-like protein [Parathielavia appendiculata]